MTVNMTFNVNEIFVQLLASMLSFDRNIFAPRNYVTVAVEKVQLQNIYPARAHKLVEQNLSIIMRTNEWGVPTSIRKIASPPQAITDALNSNKM